MSIGNEMAVKVVDVEELDGERRILLVKFDDHCWELFVGGKKVDWGCDDKFEKMLEDEEDDLETWSCG